MVVKSAARNESSSATSAVFTCAAEALWAISVDWPPSVASHVPPVGVPVMVTVAVRVSTPV